MIKHSICIQLYIPNHQYSSHKSFILSQTFGRSILSFFSSRSMNLKSLLIIWYLKNQCASGSKLQLTISHHSRLRQKYSSSSSTRHHSLIIFSFSNWFNNSTNFSIYTIFEKIKATIVQIQIAKTIIKSIATNQYKTWISSAFLVLACAFATSSCFSAVNLAQ